MIAVHSWDDFVEAARRLRPPVAIVNVTPVVDEATGTVRYHLAAAVGDLSAAWLIYGETVAEVPRDAKKSEVEAAERAATEARERVRRQLAEALPGAIVLAGSYVSTT